MLKNFDDWNIYEGAAEGSGKGKKVLKAKIDLLRNVFLEEVE